jgi:hypothetical protein
MAEINEEVASIETQLDQLFYKLKNNNISQNQYQGKVDPLINVLFTTCERLQTAMDLYIELHHEKGMIN